MSTKWISCMVVPVVCVFIFILFFCDFLFLIIVLDPLVVCSSIYSISRDIMSTDIILYNACIKHNIDTYTLLTYFSNPHYPVTAKWCYDVGVGPMYIIDNHINKQSVHFDGPISIHNMIYILCTGMNIKIVPSHIEHPKLVKR